MKPGIRSTWRALMMLVFLGLTFSACVAALLAGGAYFAVAVLRSLFGGS